MKRFWKKSKRVLAVLSAAVLLLALIPIIAVNAAGVTDHGGANLPDGKTNLVQNGDFANGTANWSLNNGNGSASIADGMAKLTVNGETGIDQTITVEAGKTYVISFYTWVTSFTNMKTGIQLNGAGISWSMQSSNGVAGVTDDWVENTYTITPTESGNLWFRIRCAWGGVGEFYVDDVCVYDPNEVVLSLSDHGGNTELPEGATELIAGGDFSDAAMTGWAKNLGTNEGVVANGYLSYIKDATGGRYVAAPGVTAQPGKTYVLSYYYWVENAAAGGAYTRVRVLSSGGTTNDQAVFGTGATYDILSEDTDGWVRVEKTFTVPADLDTAAYPQMRVWIYNSRTVSSTAVGDIYYDDISLYCVDDVVVPVTLSDHGGNTELPEGATELIAGGDFSDAAMTGWAKNLGTNEGVVANGYLSYIKDATGGRYVAAPGVTAQPGKTYVLSYYYWVENAAAGGAYTRVRVLSSGGTTNDQAVFGTGATYDILSEDTNGWVRVEKTFTVPADLDTTAYPQMRVWVYNCKNVSSTAVGDIYYDDISLYCVDDIAEEVVPTDHGGNTELPEGATELIAGGDFSDASLPDWNGNKTDNTVVVADGMLKFSKDATAQKYINSPNVAIQPGKTYVLSYYYWMTNVVTDAYSRARVLTSPGSTVVESSVNVVDTVSGNTDGWVRVEKTFTVSETFDTTSYPNMQVYLYNTYAVPSDKTRIGDLYIDDVSLYCVDDIAEEVVPTDHGGDPELPEGAVNVVDNGDFSAGQTGSYNWEAAVAVDGMAKHEAVANAYWQLNAQVEAGKTYILSYYIFVTDAPSGFSFNNFIAGAGSYVSWKDNILTSIAATTNGWQRVTYTWTAAGSGTVNIGFKNYGTAAGVYYIDDISIYCPDDIYVAPEVSYTEIHASDVSCFYAVDQLGMSRATFALNVEGVTFPADDWATYKNLNNGSYFDATIDGAAKKVMFAKIKKDSDDGTFYRGEGSILMYIGTDQITNGAVANAESITIPAGTKFLDPANALVGWHFVEDVTIVKSLAAEGWKQETAFVGSQLTLGDVLKTDVTLSIPAADFDAALQVKATVANGSASEELYFDLPDTAAANGQYVIRIPTAIKNMSDVYTLSLINGDATLGATQEYSVKSYAEAVFAAGNGESTEAVVAQVLLNYGAAAQQYFGYHVDNLANTGDGIALDEATFDEFLSGCGYPDAVADVTVVGDATDFLGYTLLLRDATTIRLNFASAVAGATEKDGRYYVEITGLGAANLDYVNTVEIAGTTYNVSALGLAKKVISASEDADFVLMMKLLTAYNFAAEMLA